ncbi:MAG: hypothetical protein U0R52_10065 [Solirubrobacterales bacterium]
MLTSVLGALGAVATLVVLIASVPRRIRRNDQAIRDRDDDLARWIEDDRQDYRRELIRIIIGKQNGTIQPRYADSQHEAARKQVLRRYENEARAAERLRSDLALTEHWPHRLVRWALGRPMPELTAPKTHAETIKQWRTPAADITSVPPSAMLPAQYPTATSAFPQQ